MERGIFEIVDTESLVPTEHLLRKIDAAVDFNKIYDMVEPLYCADNGRPSVDPVVLFKMGSYSAFVRSGFSAPHRRRGSGKYLLPLVPGLSFAGGYPSLFNRQLYLPSPLHF